MIKEKEKMTNIIDQVSLGAIVQVRDRLTAHISGSGSVHYAGNPHLETTVTGSGRVRPIS